MEEILNQAKNFKSIRDIYHQKHDELVEKRNNDRNARIKIITIKKDETSLSKKELVSFSNNMEKEYWFNFTENILDDSVPGIPCAITYPISQLIDKSFILACKKNYEYDYEYDEDTWGVDMTPKGSTPAQNYKNAYLMCVDILERHVINVTEVISDASKFENFTRSTCGESDPDSFIFKCWKNNYTFTVRYNDDCDCYPGLFYVQDIIQISPEQKIIGGDIRLEKNFNKMSVTTKDFITLLNSVNYETYVQNRFGHFFRLPSMLKSAGIEVKCYDELISPYHLHINEHDNHTYAMTIKSSNDEFDIVLGTDYTGDYCLYFRKSLKQEKNEHDIPNYFSQHDSHQMKVNYQDDDQFQYLLKYIDKYYKWKTGQYGYFENNQYFNDKHVPKFQNFNLKTGVSTHNNFFKYHFNLYCQFNADVSWPVVYSKNHPTDLKYPIDSYGITFFYDSNYDLDNCVVTIEGKWFDATPISNKYYENNNKFDQDTVILEDITSTFFYRGKYSECIQKLVEFDQKMTEINPRENNPLNDD